MRIDANWFDFRLNYKNGLSGSPSLVSGDGDGTVNARSLKACEKWGGSPQQEKKPIHSIEIPGADHMGILSDKRVVEYVLQVLIGSAYYDVNESEEHDYHKYFNNRLWKHLFYRYHCTNSNNNNQLSSNERDEYSKNIYIYILHLQF